jgi:hypothetical protein
VSSEAPPEENRIPRGALIVVAIGLIASLAAAVLATDKGSGEAANLEWVKSRPVADSRSVDVPGAKGTMELFDGEIRATGTNVSGYALYRVSTNLRIDAGSPVGDGRILCEIKGGPRSEIAQTSGKLRATYPRSSETGIYSQPVPEVLLIDFSARGNELAIVDGEDLGIRGFTTERGIKLEWPEYQEGNERLKYFIAGGKPKRDLVLPFYTVWKTTAIPAAKIACTLTTSAGKATVTTAGALSSKTPPIDEEAEERAEEEAQAQEEEEEETEDSGDEG